MASTSTPLDDVLNRNGVSRTGKPASSRVAATKAAAPQPAEPWRDVRIGDTVQVNKDDETPAGTYKVGDMDASAKTRGAQRGIYLSGQWWVRNDSVIRIVTRDGKPYGDTAPVWTKERILAEVSIGDTVEILATPKPELEPFSIAREAGIYTVIEKDRYVSRGLILNLHSETTSSGGWIPPEKLVRIVSKKATSIPIFDSAPVAPKTIQVRGDFLIHVDVPSIMSNKANGEHKPVTVTRRLSEPTVPHLARELAWDGPTRFVHHEFMRIESTDIQNWIETDAPVTCWRDTGLEVMTVKPDDKAPPMMAPILGGFVIHIAAPVLMKNRAEGRNDPVIAVRRAHTNWATDVLFARKVEWTGPTRMVHRPSTPVPGTNGRGVAFVETDAELTLYMDNAEPLVIRMPDRRPN